MTRRVAIYGSGGFAREVAPILRGVVAQESSIVFLDDEPARQGSIVNGYPVLSFEQFAGEQADSKEIVIAAANPKVRKLLTDRCEEQGLHFLSLFDPTHKRFDDVMVGEGAIFCANTVVTSNVTIGRQFQCNLFSYIAHDCRIGDFVTFAPRVCCNGNVHIEDEVYVGTGATIRQGNLDRPTRIGKGAVIGMGAVVLNDVGPGEVVVGNPAKVIRRADVSSD